MTCCSMTSPAVTSRAWPKRTIDLAKRGYSRDHRSDCQQVVLALIVTREGFPLAHYTLQALGIELPERLSPDRVL